MCQQHLRPHALVLLLVWSLVERSGDGWWDKVAEKRHGFLRHIVMCLVLLLLL